MPARFVDWDDDPKYMTDVTLLDVDELASPWLSKENAHRIFNTREYQALDHGTKMKMMWD